MHKILVYSIVSLCLVTGIARGQGAAACDSTYRVVDQMPVYKNGLEDFIRDVRKEVKFSHGCHPDKVTVRWVLDTTGKATQVEVEGIDGTCREDFIHQFELLPAWKPGKKKGRLVCVRMVLPIYITYSDSLDGR